MRRPKVLFSQRMEKDLGGIADFIGQDSPRRALTFIRELREHCAAIARHPAAYPLREEYGPGIRMTVHGRYLIFHRLRSDALVIEHIVHGARHLGEMSL